MVPLLALLTGALLSAAYMNWGNPNVRFQRKVIKKQFQSLHKPEATAQRVLVVGGSSVSFSIQPELLQQEFGLNVVNLGLPAGAGRGLHCEWALQEVRAGDLVVLSFESTGWTEQEQTLITPLGSQFWFLNIGPQYNFDSRLGEVGVKERYQWTDIRPGGKHLVTLATKLAFKQPLFRYDEENLREGGYLAGTSGWGIQPDDYLLKLELAPLQRRLLTAMKKKVEQLGARLVVSLPWRLTKDELLVEQQELNLKLIGEIEQVAPVIHDPWLGVCNRVDWYADTGWHLTEEGADARSRAFGSGLVQWLHSQ